MDGNKSMVQGKLVPSVNMVLMLQVKARCWCRSCEWSAIILLKKVRHALRVSRVDYHCHYYCHMNYGCSFFLNRVWWQRRGHDRWKWQIEWWTTSCSSPWKMTKESMWSSTIRRMWWEGSVRRRSTHTILTREKADLLKRHKVDRSRSQRFRR